MSKMISPEKQNLIKNQKGQSFLEFIMIMLLMVTISFAFLKGFRTGIGIRWELMLNIISRPDSSFRIP